MKKAGKKNDSKTLNTPLRLTYISLIFNKLVWSDKHYKNTVSIKLYKINCGECVSPPAGTLNKVKQVAEELVAYVVNVVIIINTVTLLIELFNRVKNLVLVICNFFVVCIVSRTRDEDEYDDERGSSSVLCRPSSVICLLTPETCLPAVARRAEEGHPKPESLHSRSVNSELRIPNL
jgi:hypothetical protein